MALRTAARISIVVERQHQLGGCQFGRSHENRRTIQISTSDESDEMAISRRAAPFGGDRTQPALGRSPRARGRSELSGHSGGTWPAIRAQDQPSASHGYYRRRALPCVHARGGGGLGAKCEGGGWQSHTTSRTSRGG